MAQKELLAYLVAHNLMRCVMAQAAAQHEVDLERVSFKGALDAVRQYSNAIGQARNQKLRRQLWEDLLLDLARDLVRRRPNRRNHARSNTGPNPIRCSTNRAIALWKSPTAATTGKAVPAIIEGLTKGHSGRFLVL